jgi:hypothetical protein
MPTSLITKNLSADFEKIDDTCRVGITVRAMNSDEVYYLELEMVKKELEQKKAEVKELEDQNLQLIREQFEMRSRISNLEKKLSQQQANGAPMNMQNIQQQQQQHTQLQAQAQVFQPRAVMHNPYANAIPMGIPPVQQVLIPNHQMAAAHMQQQLQGAAQRAYIQQHLQLQHQQRFGGGQQPQQNAGGFGGPGNKQNSGSPRSTQSNHRNKSRSNSNKGRNNKNNNRNRNSRSGGPSRNISFISKSNLMNPDAPPTPVSADHNSGTN